MTVSKRQLRTLAHQIGRRPGMRDVLHDALLERYTALYTSTIQRAEKLAKLKKRPFIILFDPSSAALIEGGARRPFHSYDERRRHFYIFDGGRQFDSEPWNSLNLQRVRRQPPYENAVLVYVTRAGHGEPKKLRERVMFRLDRTNDGLPLRERQGQVFALLLDSLAGMGSVNIFTLHGHTDGPLRQNIRSSRPALPNEYEPTLRAMRQRGYDNIRLVTRAGPAYIGKRARARTESL